MMCDTPEEMAESMASLWTWERRSEGKFVSESLREGRNEKGREGGKKGRRKAHIESMFVLDGSVRNEIENLDSIESMDESRSVIVVGLSNVYSELLVAGEPLWRTSDENDVLWTSLVGFEEMLKSGRSKTSGSWEDGEFRVGR